MQHAPIHCLNQMVGGEGDVEISFIYTNVTIMLHHFAETPLR